MTVEILVGADARIFCSEPLGVGGFKRGVEGLLEDGLRADKAPALASHGITALAHTALDGVGPVPAQLDLTELGVNRRSCKLERDPVGQGAFGVEEDVGHLDSAAHRPMRVVTTPGHSLGERTKPAAVGLAMV